MAVTEWAVNCGGEKENSTPKYTATRSPAYRWMVQYQKTSASVATKSGASFRANTVGPNSRKKPAARAPITTVPNAKSFARYSVKGSLSPVTSSWAMAPTYSSSLSWGDRKLG